MDCTTDPGPRVEDAYVGADGRPRLRTSIVGFLDILGFSNSIATTVDAEAAQRLVDRIHDAIADSRRHGARPRNWSTVSMRRRALRGARPTGGSNRSWRPASPTSRGLHR